MTISNFEDRIFIAHRVIGDSPKVQDIGPIALELCIFLEAKLTEQDLRDSGADPEIITGITNFFGAPYMRSLFSRGYNACLRGYDPKLILENGKLTEIGRIRALAVKPLIEELNAYQENFAYEPQKWLEADEIIVNATIPIRPLRLLKLLTDAISETEQAHAAKAMSRLSGRIAEESDIAIDLVKRDIKDQPDRRILMMEEIEMHIHTPTNDIKPEMLDIGANFIEAYVPTAPFGQRTRSDLRWLVRLGLVDMRAYLSTGRGRPKHVIRPSIPGQRVLTSLLQRGIQL